MGLSFVGVIRSDLKAFYIDEASVYALAQDKYVIEDHLVVVAV